jgi:hypothetical protein
MTRVIFNVPCVTSLTTNIQSAVEPVIAPTLVFWGVEKVGAGQLHFIIVDTV